MSEKWWKWQKLADILLIVTRWCLGYARTQRYSGYWHLIDYELFCQSADQSIDSLSQLQFWALAFAERSRMITKYTKHATLSKLSCLSGPIHSNHTPSFTGKIILYLEVEGNCHNNVVLQKRDKSSSAQRLVIGGTTITVMEDICLTSIEVSLWNLSCLCMSQKGDGNIFNYRKSIKNRWW